MYRGETITLNGDEPALMFAILGQNASFFEADFKGKVLAPNGTIVLGAADFEGNFQARNIEVRAGSTVTYWQYE